MNNVLDTLRRNGFVAKKKFGQNFITDPNLLHAIVDDAIIGENDTVIEIGAGAGTLTRALSLRAKSVLAFEIDESLKKILCTTLSDLNNVRVVFSDILKTPKEELLSLTGGKSFKVVANLPYYITTPVLFYFLESDLPITSITVMVQKEVAMRMVAKSNTPDYGVLSLSVQSRGDARITRIVGREMFYPKPNVDSAVVRIELGGKVPKSLFKLFRCAFAMRRKTLANNLMSSYGLTRQQAEQILLIANLDLKVRGEALDLNKFAELLEILENI